jgi:hypothetical protein
MGADGVYEYWRSGSVDFARAEGRKPEFLPVENLGPRSYCEADSLPWDAKHRVSCTTAFDGVAVIAESINSDPERGSLEAAVALLRAGVEHWKAISG